MMNIRDVNTMSIANDLLPHYEGVSVVEESDFDTVCGEAESDIQDIINELENTKLTNFSVDDLIDNLKELKNKFY